MDRFILADIDYLPHLLSLYSNCTNSLLQNNILQWGTWSNNYPNESYIKKSILDKELYILLNESHTVGSVILNQQQSSEWSSIEWHENTGQFLVIHAFVIDPIFQGKGFGKKLMEYCLDFASTNGFNSIRLDSFSKNTASCNLYRKSGFIERGSVIFENKPLDNKEYICFEKKLN